MEDYCWLPNTFIFISYSTKRSETRGEVDSDNKSKQILDDDVEAIEPVVYEPKDRRRNGTKKRKGRRR